MIFLLKYSFYFLLYEQILFWAPLGSGIPALDHPANKKKNEKKEKKDKEHWNTDIFRYIHMHTNMYIHVCV